MTAFRLVAFDLDNTLVGPDLIYSPRVRAAVARALAQGVVVTIATGRGPTPTDRFAAELQITAPVICFQGGLVYDCHARQILCETRLDPAVVPLAVRLAAECGWTLMFEVPGMIYLPRRSDYPPELIDLLRASPVTWVDDLLTDLPETPHKFLVFLRQPAEREALMAELRARFAASPSRITFVHSHPLLIEGMPRDVDKGTGLAWLAAYLNIPQAEVMAVGDNDNDAAMLRWAGLGVAMADSSPAALAAADELVPPVNEDGAAIALEKFVLNVFAPTPSPAPGFGGRESNPQK